jgi:DNA polymerase-1
MEKLLIIDGNAIVHRAYHAFPPLTDTKNQPIQAVYGFISMLIKVLEEVKPYYLVVCFDRPAPTFRKLLFAGYQAHREGKIAEDLPEQIDKLHDALREIGIPVFEIDGYEADDIIGTISKQASKGNLETVILSGDRDLLQLVTNNVTVFAPVIGITKFILFDEETVYEKYGVRPSQVSDYKAFIGDASDGYPGVNGIGPKTAQNLLKEYDSFENVYKHIKDLSPKIGLKLATDIEQASLAKKLATIVTDVPVHLDTKKAMVNNFSREKVDAVFANFGFNSIRKRLGVFKEVKQKDQMTLL